MLLVKLPSGIIINMDKVAFIVNAMYMSKKIMYIYGGMSRNGVYLELTGEDAVELDTMIRRDLLALGSNMYTPDAGDSDADPDPEKYQHELP